MSKFKCDLDIKAPEIEEYVTLNRGEVASNAEIYGAMIVWQLLKGQDRPDKEIIEKLYHLAVEYARTGQAMGGVLVQNEDWCVCPKHFKDWTVFKEMLVRQA